MRNVIATVVLCLTTICSIVAQNTKYVDISAVAKSGTINESRYANSYFRLSVDAPNATLQLNPTVNISGHFARLIQIFSEPTDWEHTYTFAVNAESLKNLERFPNSQPERYVRSVRHRLESEGLQTVREEFPVSISGVPFSGAVLQVPEQSGRKHYRGIYTAFRRGFILSLDVEASSEAKLNKLIHHNIRFEN